MIESHFKCQYTPFTVEWGIEADKRIKQLEADYEQVRKTTRWRYLRELEAEIQGLREQMTIIDRRLRAYERRYGCISLAAVNDILRPEPAGEE